MTVAILSFSYKRGLPEDKTGNGGGFVFDCRAMPNPYWDESLRGYTGRDKPVCEFFDRYKDKVDRFLGASETLVGQSIDEYLTDGRDHLQVAFGCTGNAPAAKRSGCLSAKREPRRGRKGPRQHRSVYFAERMAERLKGIERVEIEVEHAAKPHWKIKGNVILDSIIDGPKTKVRLEHAKKLIGISNGGSLNSR